jgi:SAM-dependent methyltransferase
MEKLMQDTQNKNRQQLTALPPNVGSGSYLVLDACCGSRMMWFDKNSKNTIYFDRRNEIFPIKPGSSHKNWTTVNVSPGVIGDFTNMPFKDESFMLVVFDPPHLSKLGDNGILAKKYGKLFGDWECEISEGFRECFRVLKTNGTLIFKWCSVEVPLSQVINLSPIKPLFGHNTGNHAKTHWLAFMKPNGAYETRRSKPE